YLGDITKPLTLNRYNYCVGSPLNYVDPSGNMVILDWFGDLLDSLPGNNSNNSKGDNGNNNRSKNKKPPITDDLTSIKELLGKPLPPELTQTPIPETKVEDDIQTAEENNMIEYVSGDDIYNEYYYFRNTKVSHEYITKKMLEDVGWNGPIEEQDIHLYNAVLQSFGITSGRSLRMFFATLIAEGNGAILENRNDYTNESYTKNTRGAGYMQVTHDYTHDSFLKFVADNYYSEDEALNSYYANLANTVTYKNHEWIFWKTQSDNDTATVIGENWAMTSAAWYWTGPRLWRYYFDEGTGEEWVNDTNSKNLDLYAQGNNGHNSQYEESEGLFLIAQYFVNGWQKTAADNKPVDDDYAHVAETGVFQVLANGNVIMNGTEYRPPKGLQARLDAYRLICEKWGTNW
ncbi:MAG: hypothetical protein K2L07_16070, partial [Lachnospiraceae bacterium]|nr:hypothetical protein [Lachnospiraceae bacterium]